MGILKVERFDFDLAALTSDVLAITDVSDLEKAFIRNTASGRGTAGRVDVLETTLTPHFATGTILLSDTNELTFNRYDATGTVKCMGEVWRYTGQAGGSNEFIVRWQGEVVVPTSTASATQAIPGIVNKNKCIPFLVGQRLNNASQYNYEGAIFSCSLDASDNLVVARGSAAAFGEARVSVAVVEFVGAAWRIGHGRIEDPYDGIVTEKTATLNDQYDYGGSAFVADFDKGFIEASMGGDSVETGIADIGFTFENVSGSGSVLTLTNHDSGARNNHEVRIFFIENTNLSIARSNVEKNPLADYQVVTPFPSITLTDLEEAGLEWYSGSGGTGIAHQRGRLGAKLTTLSEIQAWVHRRGNIVRARYGVIDLAAIIDDLYPADTEYTGAETSAANLQAITKRTAAITRSKTEVTAITRTKSRTAAITRSKTEAATITRTKTKTALITRVKNLISNFNF